MVLKTIRNRPSSVPWILFGIGIIFFGIGIYNPVASEQINTNFAIGIMFFALGTFVGLTIALRKKRRK